jgi:hypothetical protein
MTEIIKIDARVTGFSNDEIRLISLCFADSGQILVQKQIFSRLYLCAQISKPTRL